MPGERIVLDGLWRCLCPSFDAISLSKALRTPIGSPWRPSAPQKQPPCPPSSHQFRHHHAVISRKQTNAPLPLPKRYSTSTSKGLEQKRVNHGHLSQRNTVSNLISSYYQGSRGTELDTVKTETIIEDLREVVVGKGRYQEICNAVHYIVTKRGRKPNAFLYECLVKANIDPQHGSAQVVTELLKEMASEGIKPTSTLYHAVLDVLAVHPDYVLRNAIINDMNAAWQPPSFAGRISIVVGLLRDKQYEMALEKFEELHRTGVPIPAWLFDLFIFTFGEMGVHEDALMIFQHRLMHPDIKIPLYTWYFLLDTFSRDGFYEGVKYIWNRMVLLGLTIPSDGIAVSVLSTAAQNDDAAMTMHVIKTLTNRGRKLGMHHFEPLLDIQARDHDVKKAILTLCLMAKAGLRPDLSCARQLALELRSSTEQTDLALTLLHELRQDHVVPPAAFNTVLEATLHHKGFKAGLDLYRTVKQICVDGPDLQTYSLLLQRCTLHRSMRFLLAEMEAFSISPDESIYDRIILISTLHPNYESAFRYLAKMRDSETDGRPNSWWLSRGTALGLIRRCILAEDRRVQSLLKECKKRGMEDVYSHVQIFVKEAQQKRQQKLERIAVTNGDGIIIADSNVEVSNGKVAHAAGC